MRSSRGVTIIGLAVMIVIISTLALVAINSSTGENGLIKRAEKSTKDWDENEIKEELNVILADYAIDVALTDKDTINTYLGKLKEEGTIQDYRYIGKYLVQYKDIYCELKKDGYGYMVDSVRGPAAVGGAEGGGAGAGAAGGSDEEYTIITSDSVMNGSVTITGSTDPNVEKKYILLDDIEAKDFNLDIPEGQTVTIILAEDMEIDNKGFDRSAINLNKNSTLNLYIYGKIDVNSGYGKNADGNNPGEGGYAGIHVPETATLNLYGSGELIARGGNAGNGGTLTTGGQDQKKSGAGGGGAGAGIGGAGGNGGVYQNGVGASGGAGENCGKVNIYGDLTVYAYGGAGGSGGRGDNTTKTAGGGGGYPGAGIGGGGAGGAGGTCCAGAGGYSGGSGDSEHFVAINGLAGGNGVHCTGELLGGGGYFQGAEGVSNNGIDRKTTAFGGFGNQGHWHNLSDQSGSGGTAGKGGIIRVSSLAKVYAYNGNKYTDGTSYNNGQNQCPIYLQNGKNIARYTYRKENKALYNYFNMDTANDASNANRSGYKNVKVVDKVTVAGNSYLSNVDMSYQGVGSGAGFIELHNGTYTIDSSLNESPTY